MLPAVVKVRKQSDWQSIARSLRRASFEISMSNPRCSGVGLSSQLTWAKNHFERFDFSIADTLNVYNYTTVGHPQFGVLDYPKAYEVAYKEGDAWLSENLSTIVS